MNHNVIINFKLLFIYFFVFILIFFSGFNATLAQQPKATNAVVKQIINEYIATEAKQGTKVIGLGSWITGQKYRDPLSGAAGVASDHDMRIIVPSGASDQEAFEQWKKAQTWIKERIKDKFGSKADDILKTINVYPPEQLTKNVNNVTEAKKLFNNVLKATPNLGNEEVEGLYSKASKGWKQSYESKKGMLIYQDPKTNRVVTTSADLEHLTEGQGKFTLGGMSDIADEWVEHLDDAIIKRDPVFIKKYLERLDEALAKGKSMGRVEQSDYLKRIINQLDSLGPDDVIDDDMMRSIKGAIKKGQTESKLLRALSNTTNPRDVKIIYALLEENNTKWKRLKSAVANAADQIPLEAVLQGIFIAFDTYQSYEAYKSGDPEKAFREALASALSAVGLGPGILATMTNAIIEDAKESGYIFAANRQDCEGLLVGECNMEGRTQVLDKDDKVFTKSFEQILAENKIETEAQFDSIFGPIIQYNARKCSERGFGGPLTSQTDQNVGDAAWAKCSKQLRDKWNKSRMGEMAELADLLEALESELRAGEIMINIEPDPTIISDGANDIQVELTPNFNYNSDTASRYFARIAAIVKKQTPNYHLKLETIYKWFMDGKEISSDSTFEYSGQTNLFVANKAIKKLSFSREGKHETTFKLAFKLTFSSNSPDLKDDDIIYKIKEQYYKDKLIIKQGELAFKVEKEASSSGSVTISGPDEVEEESSFSLTAELDNQLKAKNNLFVNWYAGNKSGSPIATAIQLNQSIPKGETAKTYYVEVIESTKTGPVKVAEAEKTVKVNATEDEPDTKDDDKTKTPQPDGANQQPGTTNKPDDNQQPPVSQPPTTQGQPGVGTPSDDDTSISGQGESIQDRIKDLSQKTGSSSQQTPGTTITNTGIPSGPSSTSSQTGSQTSSTGHVISPQNPDYEQMIKELPANQQRLVGLLKDLKVRLLKQKEENKKVHDAVIQERKKLDEDTQGILGPYSYFDVINNKAKFSASEESVFEDYDKIIDCDIHLRTVRAEKEKLIDSKVSTIDTFIDHIDPLTEFINQSGDAVAAHYLKRKVEPFIIEIQNSFQQFVLVNDCAVNAGKSPNKKDDETKKESTTDDPCLLYGQIDTIENKAREIQQQNSTLLEELNNKRIDIQNELSNLYDTKTPEGTLRNMSSDKYPEPYGSKIRELDQKLNNMQDCIRNLRKENSTFNEKLSPIFGTASDYKGEMYPCGAFKSKFSDPQAYISKYQAFINDSNKNLDKYVLKDICSQDNKSPDDNVITYKGTISGLSSKETYGTSKNISVSMQASSSGSAGSDVTIFWNSNNSLPFSPQSSTATSTNVTFNRMENPSKFWAEFKTVKDGTSKSSGESDQAEVEVVAPKFTVSFEPPLPEVKVGQPVKVTISSEPAIDDSLIDFRWVEPSDRKEISNGVIEVTPKDTKPIKLHAMARVPSYGDSIDDNIIAELAPAELKVTAEVVGAKYDSGSKQWQQGQGLQDNKKPLLVDQHVLLRATVEGIEKEKVLFSWSVAGEGCSIVAGPTSSEVTMSKSEPGSCNAKVVVSDKEKRKLGEAETSFTVENDQDKEVQELMNKAHTMVVEGKLDEAIELLTGGKSLYPDYHEIGDYLKKLTEEKATVMQHLATVKNLVSQTKFDEAQKALQPAKSLHPKYQPVIDAENLIKSEKNKLITSKIAEATPLITACKFDEADKLVQEVLKIDSSNSQANELINQIKTKQSTFTSLVDKTKGFVANNKFVEAFKELESAQKICPADPLLNDLKEQIALKLKQLRDEIAAKIAEAQKALNNKEFDECITLVGKARTDYQAALTQEESSQLNTIESTAKQLKAEKEKAILELKAGEQLYNNQQYEEAVQKFNYGLDTMAKVWSANDPEPAYYDNLRKNALNNIKLINQYISNAEKCPTNTIENINKAIDYVDQALKLQSKNQKALTLKKTLEEKLEQLLEKQAAKKAEPQQPDTSVTQETNVVPVVPMSNNSVVPLVPMTNNPVVPLVPMTNNPVVPLVPMPNNPVVPMAPQGGQQAMAPIVPIAPDNNMVPVVPNNYIPQQQPPVYQGSAQNNNALLNQYLASKGSGPVTENNVYVSVDPDDYDQVMSQLKTNRDQLNMKRGMNNQNTTYTPLDPSSFDTNPNAGGSSSGSSLTSRVQGLSQQTAGWAAQNNVKNNQNPCQTPCNNNSSARSSGIPVGDGVPESNTGNGVDDDNDGVIDEGVARGNCQIAIHDTGGDKDDQWEVYVDNSSIGVNTQGKTRFWDLNLARGQHNVKAKGVNVPDSYGTYTIWFGSCSASGGPPMQGDNLNNGVEFSWPINVP